MFAGRDLADGPVMNPRSQPVTIRDVALRAGVSTATVSRVLAGIGNSRPGTAAAVMAAADELGYRPSGIARSLRMRRTRTLGLIVTDILNPFFPELVQAADLAARSLGYSILLGSAAYDQHRAMHYLNLMADHRVDGLIIASSQLSDESWAWLLASPVPAVVVNAEPPDLPLAVITSDNEAGGRIAVEHLVGLGHRRLAYVDGAPDFTAAVPRLIGFRRACAAAGLSTDDCPIVRGKGLFESGEGAVAELLATGADVTAIVCYNDVTAIGVLRALRAAGRRVPEDISVIGFDDIAAASWVVPGLTTVGQHKADMGRLAVEQLVARLDHEEPWVSGIVRLPMELRARESTGPAPTGAPAPEGAPAPKRA